jgi:Methylamine utilisation protein MauE
MTAVAASAAAASMPGVDQILAAQLAALLALLLAVSAAHKWWRWQHTVGVARDFAGVPRAAAPAAALSVGLAEFLAAGLLCLPAYRVLGALLAASILTVYLALIARALIAGRRDIDCGCSFGRARHALGAFEVARNAVLAAMALFVAASAARGGPAIAPSQALAAAALLALYGALDQVMGLQPMRKGAVL